MYSTYEYSVQCVAVRYHTFLTLITIPAFFSLLYFTFHCVCVNEKLNKYLIITHKIFNKEITADMCTP